MRLSRIVLTSAPARSPTNGVSVIILTASESKTEFVQAMKLECSGIMLKQTASDLIAKCIRKVSEGEMIWRIRRPRRR
jgi:DNA-binding NarL/FixJ family response regulator